MTRQRLQKEKVGEPLTYTNSVRMVFEEPIILHSTAHRLKYSHWSAHLDSFLDYMTGNSPTYNIEGNYEELVQEIKSGLSEKGFNIQSKEIQNIVSEEDLNKRIIRQYTEESDLFYEVNRLLRNCHNFQDDNENQGDEDVEKYHTPLAPWILQLNTAIRKEPYSEDMCYRGVQLSEEDIDKYKEGEIFVWASFVSASKSKEVCFGGNVLFEIFTETAMPLNDKRFPRDVAHLSDFPEEQEVIYPLACAYRVRYKKIENGITIIGIATVDYN